MFKIKVTTKQEGKKRSKKQESGAIFNTVDAAKEFIYLSIKRQESICWKAWGMMVTNTTSKENTITAEYKPAMILFGKLVQTFEIIEA